MKLRNKILIISTAFLLLMVMDSLAATYSPPDSIAGSLQLDNVLLNSGNRISATLTAADNSRLHGGQMFTVNTQLLGNASGSQDATYNANTQKIITTNVYESDNLYHDVTLLLMGFNNETPDILSFTVIELHSITFGLDNEVQQEVVFLQGPKGDIGPQGEQGERGLQGQRGHQGLTGPVSTSPTFSSLDVTNTTTTEQLVVTNTATTDGLAVTGNATITGNASAAQINTTGTVSAAGVNTTGNINVDGFTKLGSTAPSVKMKKFTGTTSNSQGGHISIVTGVSQSKIISASLLIAPASSNQWISRNYNLDPGYQAEFIVRSSGNIEIYNINGNSGKILSVPYVMVIWHQL